MKRTIVTLLATSAVLVAALGVRAEDAAPAAAGPEAAPARKGAGKSCDELKTEIAAKLDAKGVKKYTLDVVAPDATADAKVVGSCEGGKQRIVYKRG